jgi:hypothetical protein
MARRRGTDVSLLRTAGGKPGTTSLLERSFQNRLDHADEGPGAEGLPEESLGTLGVLVRFTFFDVAAVKDRLEARPDGARGLQQIEPGQVRHQEIREHEVRVRVRLPQPLQGFARIMETDRAVSAQFQHRLDDVADHQLVVHH